MILTSSDDVKRVVYETAMAKKNIEEQHRLAVRKHHLETQNMERNTCRRLGWVYFFPANILFIMVLARGEQERDFSNFFLVIPTAEEEHHCYEAFYDATSN